MNDHLARHGVGWRGVGMVRSTEVVAVRRLASASLLSRVARFRRSKATAPRTASSGCPKVEGDVGANRTDRGLDEGPLHGERLERSVEDRR